MKKRIINVTLLCISLFATAYVLTSNNYSFKVVFAEDPSASTCYVIDRMGAPPVTKLFCYDRGGLPTCLDATYAIEEETEKCNGVPPPN